MRLAKKHDLCKCVSEKAQRARTANFTKIAKITGIAKSRNFVTFLQLLK